MTYLLEFTPEQKALMIDSLLLTIREWEKLIRECDALNNAPCAKAKVGEFKILLEHIRG